MKIINHKGARYVLRKVKGKLFAAAFNADLDDRQIKSWMMNGDAAFFPFNKETWEFEWEKSDGKPRYIRR